MLQIKHGRLNGYFKMQPAIIGEYVRNHPELKPFVHAHCAGSHLHFSIDDMPVPSTKGYRIEAECITIEKFDIFYALANVRDETQEPIKRKRSSYFLVRFDDGNGNLAPNEDDPKTVVGYLRRKGFACKAGFWGRPWYFIDIADRFYMPGRPGVCYGEVVGGHSISFEEFKEIYSLYERYDKDGPIFSAPKKEPIRVIIDTSSCKERLELIARIKERYPSTKGLLLENQGGKRGFRMVAFHEGKGYGFVGTVVARDLRKQGFDHCRSAKDFIVMYC